MPQITVKRHSLEYKEVKANGTAAFLIHRSFFILAYRRPRGFPSSGMLATVVEIPGSALRGQSA